MQESIPKIAHFYWGAKTLPFLRYFTIYSFHKFNPDWKIMYYTPVELSDKKDWPTAHNKSVINAADCTSVLLSQPWVHHEKVDFEQFGMSNDLPEVTKSDYIRLHLLYHYGGLWSDMDIIFFRPLSRAFENLSFSSYFCRQQYDGKGQAFHSIGFLMSSVKSEIFKALLEKAKDSISSSDYQSIGSPYYDKIVQFDEATYNIPMSVVYSIYYYENAWNIPAYNFSQRLQSNSIGLHWYGGTSQSAKYQNIVCEHNASSFDNIYCYLTNMVLRGIDVPNALPLASPPKAWLQRNKSRLRKKR